MDPITPRPLPADIRTEPEIMGWTVGMPIARTVDKVGTGPHAFAAELVAAPQTVTQAFQYDPRSAINDEAFVAVGTSYEAALAAARARAARSFDGDPSNKGMITDWQSQAVLQASSGTYYVTGLREAQRGGSYDFEEPGAVHEIDPSSVDPALCAIVGRDSWIPMPGHDAPAPQPS
jgi:hypothetical protein